MHQLKKFTFLLVFVVASCSSQKNLTLTNDDYEIINLFLNRYTDTLFYSTDKTIYKVYEDSILLNENFTIRTNKFKGESNKKALHLMKKINDSIYLATAKINPEKIENQKIKVTNSVTFNKRKQYPKESFHPKKDNSKIKIDRLTYQENRQKAILKISEIVYTPEYGTIWDTTEFWVKYEKKNNKWIMIGNTNKSVH